MSEQAAPYLTVPPDYRALLESTLAAKQIKRQRAHGLAAGKLDHEIDQVRRELDGLRRQQS